MKSWSEAVGQGSEVCFVFRVEVVVKAHDLHVLEDESILTQYSQEGRD